jgi:hypothetical protein
MKSSWQTDTGNLSCRWSEVGQCVPYTSGWIQLALLLLMAGFTFPAFAATSVTGNQLEQFLVAAHGKPDAKVAKQLLGLELTERLSATRFSGFREDLPGSKARRALMALADMSAFLDLPATEILVIAKPDPEAQHKMISLMMNYVKTTIHQLPNFSATRLTTSFQRNLSSSDSALHPDGRHSGIVLYRDGEERLNSIGSESKVPGLTKSGGFGPILMTVPGLTTSGEFGPILMTALLDAARGNLMWSHWEQAATGPAAVYRYAVPAEESHYLVANQLSGYKGEIAIDPSDGAVLRLVLRAEPPPLNPRRIADIVVEYGSVELGGKTYICPLKGVALFQGLDSIQLNDVGFQQYRLFRASTRMLPGFSELP